MFEYSYIVLLFVFVVLLYVFMYKICYFYLFDVLHEVNTNQELVVLSSKVKIFWKTLGIGSSILITYGISLFLKFYIEIPMILAKVPVRGNKYLYLEQNNRLFIAIVWIILTLSFAISTAIRFLHSLTKKYRKYKNKIIIYLWGPEYAVLILIQGAISVFCVDIVFTTLYGNYSESIQTIWNCLLYSGVIILLINGMFTHHRMVIYTNGIVTYSKYNKKGTCKKDDISFEYDETDIVKIRIKGNEMFSIQCIPANKKEMVEGLKSIR